MVVRETIESVQERASEWVLKQVSKFSYPPFGRQMYEGGSEQVPAYERSYSPYQIKSIAERQSFVNNAIEEKVQQSFRRGFSEPQKEWAAECQNCKYQFDTLQPFVDQLGDDENVDTGDIDLSKPRLCPECGELATFDKPSQQDRDEIEHYLSRANMQDAADEILPDGQSSVSQTFLGVCKEVAHDIQTFDDGWMLFQRRYRTDPDGKVVDWQFEGAYRAPPFLMRYSTDKSGKMGGEYWLCVECRASNPETYTPEDSPGECPDCGSRMYEVFAYLKDGPNGSPQQFFIQGEFAHDSEYRPTRLYGLSPIISLHDEANALESMDSWFRSAYEKRRAPRGALVINSSNRESVRAWNQEQMNKLSADSQHIPVFMGGGEDSSGSPISWQPLLESPADMQQMQMREAFADRIAAKYGVTNVFQNASAQSTGMSQSLEIVVTNRSVERLQRVFSDTFIPAFMGNIETPGWEIDLKRPEEEDEQAEAQLAGRHLNNARTAQDLGLDFEWTRNDDLDIKPDLIEAPDEEEEGGEEGGGLGGLFSSDPDSGGDGETSNPSDRPTAADDGIDPAGTTSTSGGRPRDPNEMSGQPRDERKPSSDEPMRRSEGTVTTNTPGYSNPTYGGVTGRTIDILRDVRDGDGDDVEKVEQIDKIAQSYNLCVAETDGELPNFERVEGSCRNRPDTDYRAFKRNNPGKWTRYVEADHFVRQVYDTLDQLINDA